MKSLSFLFVLIAQPAAAQHHPTPVYFMGPGNVEVDTALWRKFKLQSATVTQTYHDSMVIAYFESDSLYRPTVQYNKNTLTHSAYRGARLATQAFHKNVHFGYFHLPHDIDSLSYVYVNDSTVVIRKKQYQLGSTRNARNEDLNEQWYLLRWEDFDWNGTTYVTFNFPYYTQFRYQFNGTYPNGAYRVPSYENRYVLDTKFKTDYIDTALYCIRDVEEVRMKDSVISLTETVEPDVAFTPPTQFIQPWTYGNGYINYHEDTYYRTTTESKYDENGLLSSIESKTYRSEGKLPAVTTTLVSSETLYRFAYTFYNH